MHETFVALTLLCLTAGSGVIAYLLPRRIPQALIQIAVGVGASLLGLTLPLDTDLFLLLLIPPLLFMDAYQIPMREFRELRQIILAFAIGLVLFSTVAGGYFLHWIMPAITLPAAMALAAALSPTDAVSVGSLLGGGRAPARLTQLLHGEALLNDASGLVCFKFAVAAATTGLFSLKVASANFAYVALGGIVIGAVLAWLLARIEIALIHRGYDSPGSQILTSLLIPFGVYLAAEHVHCSGILAAVAGGIAARLSGVSRERQIGTRMKATMMWETVGTTLNGVVFVLLGLQLPALVGMANRVSHADGLSPWILPAVVVAMQVVMSLLRALWVVLSSWVRYLFGRMFHWQVARASWSGVLVMTLAGTRGAITLAAILSLPAESDMPERSILIAIAAGVIILSLLVASIGLPHALDFLPQDEGETPAQRELHQARLTLTRSAIAALQEEQAELAPDDKRQGEIVANVLTEYKDWLRRLDSSGEDPDHQRETSILRRRNELALRLRVLRLQRRVLRGLLLGGDINDVTDRTVGRQMDLQEQELLIEAGDLPRVTNDGKPGEPTSVSG